VPDQVVRLADELFVAVPADTDERGVAMGDLAAGVGAGNQQFIAGKVVVLLGHRQVDAHKALLMRPRNTTGQALRFFSPL